MHNTITLSHGGGGKAMAHLIDKLFITTFDNELLNQKNDQAIFDVKNGRMVISTDAHVISPIFFPGGDIGSLSVNGTVNDVAMAGAIPLYLTASCIIEEGFLISDLEIIAHSMANAAKIAGVSIIAGDTKVVEKGKGDGIFITTTGVGVVPDGVNISANRATPGDVVIISGYIADHGIAVMSKRKGLEFDVPIESDTAALNWLVKAMIDVCPEIHCMRDPTRGGVGAVLNEFADQSAVGFLIEEEYIPVREATESACELLGIDPLYVANEGKLLVICPEESSVRLLKAMKAHPLGKDSAIIGKVIADPKHFVQMKTKLGGYRIVDWILGDQLPRIC